MTPIIIICIYLALLLLLGVVSNLFFRGTAQDYFVASRSIGSFLLLMSVFGTTMTAFAMVGSTGAAYERGIGVYGLMASSSGLVHSACFFLIGIKIWAIGKRYGYVTQCQFFRDRFESNAIGYLLFPLLVAMVIPYLLVGILGAGSTIRAISVGIFPEIFPGILNPQTGQMQFVGAIPPWLTGLVVCSIVLAYVFLGGLRGAAWANTMQTLVFMITGVVAFLLIAKNFGGLSAASQKLLEVSPQHAARKGLIVPQEFLSYMFVPLSVGMFPHLFQHWLTAKSAKAFRLTVILHPVFIMIVWVPCILMGIWAVGQGLKAPNPNAILGIMVNQLHSPVLTGIVTAGILAAIMSSLDSQFMCISSMFTNDVVIHHYGPDHFSDKQKVMLGRCFVIVIVIITYLFSLFEPRKIFDLGVWCFSGFSGLFPLVFAALYWKRATRAGAYACIFAMAITWIVLFVRSDFGHGEGMINGIMPVTFIIAASTLALVGVSLITAPLSNQTIQKFFTDQTKANAQ